MAAQLKALVKIQPMGGKALMAGVQMHALAAVRLRVFDQPIEQGAGETLRSLAAERGQIIDIQYFAPGQKFGETETRHAFNRALLSNSQNLVRLRLLAADLRQKLIRLDVRAQLAEHRKTGLNFRVGIGNENIGSHGYGLTITRVASGLKQNTGYR